MEEKNNNLQKEDISFILLTHKDFLENIKGSEFNTYAKLVTISKVNLNMGGTNRDMERFLYEENLREELEKLKKEGVKIPGVRTIETHIKKLSKISIDNKKFNVIEIVNTPNGIAYKIKQSYEGKYFVSIPYKQMKELVIGTNQNMLKLYCIFNYMCNEEEYTKITRSFLCNKMGFVDTEGNRNEISIMINVLRKLGYLHIKQEHIKEIEDNGNIRMKTVNFYKLTTYKYWLELTETKKENKK